MVEVLDDLQLRLRSGSTFGDALAQHPKVFPGYYVAIVRAAELTGKLDDALDQLSDYIEREVAARKEVKSALDVSDDRVLPRDRGADRHGGLRVCRSSARSTRVCNAHLPLPTRMLLAFTNFMSNWWWLVLLIIGGVVLVMGG